MLFTNIEELSKHTKIPKILRAKNFLGSGYLLMERLDTVDIFNVNNFEFFSKYMLDSHNDLQDFWKTIYYLNTLGLNIDLNYPARNIVLTNNNGLYLIDFYSIDRNFLGFNEIVNKVIDWFKINLNSFHGQNEENLKIISDILQKLKFTAEVYKCTVSQSSK